ncbi:MAG: response regulator [Cytophagales bacterium]|nr:response regulator [Cytophagales bacterium]
METTVLYVDDEDVNLFLFSRTFESTYNVLTARSGAEGLGILEANKEEIIVVISDMKMPEMNGIEFITKAKNQFKNVSYFILTGFAHNNEIEVALKTGLIQRFFIKPFDVSEIQMAITESLENLSLD